MRRLFRSLCLALLFCTPAGAIGAQDHIRLARTPDISPDGQAVAFSYLGDIWIVPVNGGVARPVTSHPAHDLMPVFSPDGKQIAFSSNRHGGYDVFVVPVQGGKPRRLTFDSASDMVCGWSADGKQVLFASMRSPAFPHNFELYTVPVEGGRTHRVSAAEGKEGVFSPVGDRLAYVRGPGHWYRKGYRGSSNDDIWIADANGRNNQRLTNFVGQDTSPMWSGDGQFVYYVSEFHGTPANIVRLPAPARGAASAPNGVPKQITFHKDEGVRRARVSRDGSAIVYECGADLFVVSTRDGSQPRKLAIEVFADDKWNTERIETFTSKATEFAVSPDDRHVIFAVQGELFLMPATSNSKVTRLTDTPANDHAVAWAPDGSKIVFLSDRGGQEDLYLLEQNDPDHPKFVEAHRFKVTRLTDTREAETAPSFSPDGRRISFLRSGRLWTMNIDGSDAKAVVKEPAVFDYEWSPDSKWVAYARRDGSFASELYIAPATGPTPDNPPRNVTRHATYNAGVTWSADGKKLAFLSDRRGQGNLFILSLTKPAATGFVERWAIPGMPAGIDIDWDDLHRRVRLVSSTHADDAVIAPDGNRVAFRASSQGSSDLWVASTSGGQVTRLTTGNLQPRHIQWSRRKILPGGGYTDLIYFLDGSGRVRSVRAGGGEAKVGGGAEPATLAFKVKMTVRTEELYAEMFDQSWRYLAEHFYDPRFHGSDWNAVRNRYRPLLKHVVMREDLFTLLYLMMGELNASHLGVSSREGPVPDEVTADLGLVFDEAYRGKGLKIVEALKRGPADRRGVMLRPGEFVTAIDGVEIDDKVDLSKLLNGKVGETVLLTVAANPAADARDLKARRRVEIQAVTRESVAELMYDRWVDSNARRVAELSQGKLGYIHIPSMDEAGLDRFVRSLYSDNFDKEAIVLDVRFNGGGFTHDQVLNYLGGRGHAFFRQRDGGEGLVLRSYDRKWTRPLVLLINNRSFSDAEIFPNAFRTFGLGRLVGQPTGGLVIGTGALRLIDGSTFRIPRIGVFTAKGVNMEKEGVAPDVTVENTPDQLAQGLDAQLDRAVEVLKDDLAAWKKKNQPNVAAGAGSPMPPPMPVVPK